MKKVFTGVATALVTPFDNGKINYSKLEELIEIQIQSGVDAIVSCGSTGEASTLDDEEHISVIDYTVKTVNGRVKVIAGTGSNDTAHGIKLAQKAQCVGADALLSVTPYYNKTTQKGLIEHYKAISNEVSIPIILYNIPSRTGMNIQPETLKELSNIKGIVGVKECNFTQIAKTKYLCGDQLAIYTGDDISIVPSLALGCDGVISTMSNIIPRETKKIVDDFVNGHLSEAIKAQIYYVKLIEALFIEVNPIPIKEAMNILGYNVGKCRLPLPSMDNNNKEFLEKVLHQYGIVKK